MTLTQFQAMLRLYTNLKHQENRDRGAWEGNIDLK